MSEKWSMTTWQRELLLAAFIVACRMEHPTAVWFPRRAFEHLMWFDWRDYHTKKINELIERKWMVEGRHPNGTILYRLTPAGHGQIAIDFGAAAAVCNYDPPLGPMFAGADKSE